MRVPLLVEMKGGVVMCVGGGTVAAAKAAAFRDAGAHVIVIAPEVTPALATGSEILRRHYTAGDIDRRPRPRLVLAATGVAEVDDRVAAEAASLGIWCLRTDSGPTGPASEVALPAIVRRGQVMVALSTGAPALSKRLREMVLDVIDERWERAAEVLSALRDDPEIQRALRSVEPSVRRARWSAAVDELLIESPSVPGSVPSSPAQPRPTSDRVRALLMGDPA